MVRVRNTLLIQLTLFFLLVAQVMNEEQRIAVCKTGLERIYAMLRGSPQDWRNFVTLGRSVIAHIDATTFMQKESRTTEQAWMIAGLQRLAFADAENGGVPDIAAWCSRQWFVIFQRDQINVAALRGIGQAWLSRAQPTLARIQRQDSSSSSGGSQRSGGSQASPSSRRTASSAEQERQAAATAREAERKAGTADYVEARGFLQPATEYLDRAVAAAGSQRVLSGDLLATVRCTGLLCVRSFTDLGPDSRGVHVARKHLKPPRERTTFSTGVTAIARGLAD